MMALFAKNDDGLQPFFVDGFGKEKSSCLIDKMEQFVKCYKGLMKPEN